MAMDKEMLLQRLQTQYLTRQEVLYKLPLNISINTFWPELVDRRKMNSVMLPLHRGDGKPYWYVLTDKMIAASEKLCSLALDCSDAIDPYRTGMTSAMTEEMFFTSFVEGAQISLQEAMQFLERGTEPENVQEQLIQNNRSAWSDMIKMLFYPLDERFIRSLAFRLTSEMEGQANDYRQTDEHLIAAMGSEAYEVPAAANIPALMQEYYAFLASTEVHPLIKAAVGQAYMLVTRPFPDGNERLSRMISYAILLRSGYDFFRDISISGMIARENYRYYKSMQDIIRAENSGDLTYFIEYYLDLLARAIDAKAEQEQHRQQEVLERERAAARQPLGRAEQPAVPEKEETVQAESTGTVRQSEQQSISDLLQASIPITVDEDDEDFYAPKVHPQSPPVPLVTRQQYAATITAAENDYMSRMQMSRKQRITTTLRRLLNDGVLDFTRVEWEQASGTSDGTARDDCNALCRMGLIFCDPTANGTDLRHYHIPIIRTEDAPAPTPITPERKGVRQAIEAMLQSPYIKERKAAEGLLNMLNNGMVEFTSQEWLERNPIANRNDGFGLIRIAANHGFLTCSDGVYKFAEEVADGPQCFQMPEKQRDTLLQLMSAFPDEKFTVRNASELTGIKYSTMGYYLDNFMQRGILTVEHAPGNINRYSFSDDVHGIFEAADETNGQTEFKQLPAAEKQVHDPMRGAAEAG